MAKTYQKVGDSLKELEEKVEIVENVFTIKELRKEVKSINDKIDLLKAMRDDKQLLIDKCLELNIKEI